MAPATSDANENKWAELNKARAESMKWKLLIPLLYAPTLPLIRIGLRHNPDLRVKAYSAKAIRRRRTPGTSWDRTAACEPDTCVDRNNRVPRAYRTHA